MSHGILYLLKPAPTDGLKISGRSEIVHKPAFPQRLAKRLGPLTILYRGIQPTAILILTFLVSYF